MWASVGDDNRKNAQWQPTETIFLNVALGLRAIRRHDSPVTPLNCETIVSSSVVATPDKHKNYTSSS